MKEKTDCNKHKWIPLLGVDKKKTIPTSLFTCLKCGDLKVGVETIKISRFRLDMGGLPINNVAGISLTNVPPTDVPMASGLIITATVNTNAQGIGAPLFMDVNGELNTADATSSATSPCVALAVEVGTGSKKVLLHGILRTGAWTKGPGTAGLIYVSTTTGTLTQTPISDIENNPPTTDKVIQPVGWALSNGFIYFAPSMIYLTHV
ncbi:MAG: hypothetical protein ABIF11_10615 [Nitrospirota bacterium]